MKPYRKHRDYQSYGVTFDDVLTCLGMIAIFSSPFWMFYLVEFILTTFFGAQ